MQEKNVGRMEKKQKQARTRTAARQVHDELVFDCPDEHVDFATREVKSIMETSHRFSVPIIADPGKGRSWLEAK